MTTKVKIVPEIHQDDRAIVVQVIQKGEVVETVTLKKGETSEHYVYDIRDLHIKEVILEN